MSWFANRKKNPKLGSSGMVSSGSVEKPASATWLEGDGQGLHNPLAWDSIPSSLQEKFPHWKDKSPGGQKTQQASASQAEGASYSCYKTTYNTKQQPDYTFPYVVMDNDTLSSIAVKFETTPAELTRLNKKPTQTIFTGEVLYVPDHDEIARSAPKSAPASVSTSTPSNDQLPGSMDSQETLGSGSISHPLPDSSPATTDMKAMDEEVFEEREEEGGGGESEVEAEAREEGVLPPYSDEPQELFEEVTDTHVVLVSRYISDDQGCAHGNLMINQTAMMFTPFPTEPLVLEHGSASFEIMIPLQDIIFAAFTRDVTPPQSKKALRAALLAAEEKTSEHLSENTDRKEGEEGGTEGERKSGEAQGSEMKDEETRSGEQESEVKVPEKVAPENQETRTNGEVQGDLRNGDHGDSNGDHGDGLGDGGDCHGDDNGGSASNKGSAEQEAVGQDEPSVGDKDTATEAPGAESTGGSQTSLPRLQNSHEELLAILGHADSPSMASHRESSTHTTSEGSVGGDSNLLSDQPRFLHVRVSHKCSAAHTYLPLNRGLGIDIPYSDMLNPNKSLLQQVKTTFCFAVAECRVNDLVKFITKYHPASPEKHNLESPSSWANGTFEFLSYEDTVSYEDLNFSDNHFMGAESSESWEVYSLKDVSRYRQKIDKMDVEAGLPLPNLSEASSLMDEAHLRALSDTNNILSAAVGHDWYLIYSTFKHGISLRTLYRNMATVDLPESAVVLLVRDEQHKLFGAALTVPLKLSEKFYGTGESYLFTFESPTDIKVFEWTGENNYFVKGSPDGVCIGCGDGHAGLWLDESLLTGTSEECATFGNTCLSSKSEFICTGVEAWGFL